MIETGDWLEPSLGDEFRAKKPPLAYWLAALSGLTVGGGRVTDLAAKLPSVLAALGTVLAVFALGRRSLGSRRAGFLAALALVGTELFWTEAHTAAVLLLVAHPLWSAAGVAETYAPALAATLLGALAAAAGGAWLLLAGALWGVALSIHVVALALVVPLAWTLARSCALGTRTPHPAPSTPHSPSSTSPCTSSR